MRSPFASGKMKFWTTSEFETVMEQVSKWGYRVAFELMYWLGLRVAGEDTAGPPKAENSIRDESMPPYMSTTQFVGTLKSKSALTIFDRDANLKYKYRGQNVWCRGYYVDTVRKNEKMIQFYIQSQLEEDFAGN